MELCETSGDSKDKNREEQSFDWRDGMDLGDRNTKGMLEITLERFPPEGGEHRYNYKTGDATERRQTSEIISTQGGNQEK